MSYKALGQATLAPLVASGVALQVPKPKTVTTPSAPPVEGQVVAQLPKGVVAAGTRVPPSPTLVEAARAKVEQGAARLREVARPFARPAYCRDFAQTRYKRAAAVAPAGSVIVLTGQLHDIPDAAAGKRWADAALANALYLVGSRRGYLRAAQPWKVGTRSEPRLMPFDAGFEMSQDGRFKIGWVAVYVAADVNTEEIRGLLQRMGILASQRVLGRSVPWLAFPYVLEPGPEFVRELSTASTLRQGGYLGPGQSLPPGSLPAWLPPQDVPTKKGVQQVADGTRAFDPAEETRYAITWRPTGLLKQRPFWLLAHLQRRVRDSDWISWDGSFAETDPSGNRYVGVIVSVAPARVGSRTTAQLINQLNSWARELNNKSGQELRGMAAEAVQRVHETHNVRMPAAHIRADHRTWGLISGERVPSGSSCANFTPLRLHSAPNPSVRADACGVPKQWQNLQRDDSGVWRDAAWGYMSMVNRQAVPTGPRGTMADMQHLRFSPGGQLAIALEELPAAMRVPSNDNLANVALRAEGAVSDFAVIFQGMLGGIAAAQSNARRVIRDAETQKARMSQAIQIAASAASLRGTMITRARGYLQPGVSLDEAAQFFAEAKAAVQGLLGKLRDGLGIAQARAWASPEQAYGIIVATLQRGVEQMDARLGNAPEKVRQRGRCFYLEQAEKQLGPMTEALQGDLVELPRLSEELARLAPGAIATLEQLLAELADIESQVGIPWYLKRGPLGLPAYGWLGIGAAGLIGAGAWAVSRKKRRKGKPRARKGR